MDSLLWRCHCYHFLCGYVWIRPSSTRRRNYGKNTLIQQSIQKSESLGKISESPNLFQLPHHWCRTQVITYFSTILTWILHHWCGKMNNQRDFSIFQRDSGQKKIVGHQSMSERRSNERRSERRSHFMSAELSARCFQKWALSWAPLNFFHERKMSGDHLLFFSTLTYFSLIVSVFAILTRNY